MTKDLRLRPKPSVIKVLFARAGGRCSKCKNKITKDGKEADVLVIAAVAHIEAVKKGEARYNEKLTAEEKRAYKNLMILCENCHKEVDEDSVKYGVEKLRSIKSNHEEWVDGKLEQGIPNITFEELAKVTKYLLSESLSSEDYTIIPPRKKIKKNNLSNSVSNLITIGMVQSNLVKRYINECVTDDFYNKLRAGFVEKYLELKEEGYKSDSLFYELHNFSSGGSYDVSFRVAGLAVLTYFFEICEIFEK